jgi:hypothetical protein
MPGLVRTFAFRLFGTKQLAAASVLRLVGFLLAVCTLPYVVFWTGMLVYLTFIFSLLIGGYGLFTVIIPILVLVADCALLYLLYLLARVYITLISSLFKWGYHQYTLAAEDVRLQYLLEESNTP